MPQDKEVAEALQKVARALILLGNADAVTPQGSTLGALEAHGMAIIEAADKIADALNNVADAIRESKAQ